MYRPCTSTLPLLSVVGTQSQSLVVSTRPQVPRLRLSGCDDLPSSSGFRRYPAVFHPPPPPPPPIFTLLRISSSSSSLHEQLQQPRCWWVATSPSTRQRSFTTKTKQVEKWDDAWTDPSKTTKKKKKKKKKSTEKKAASSSSSSSSKIKVPTLSSVATTLDLSTYRGWDAVDTIANTNSNTDATAKSNTNTDGYSYGRGGNQRPRNIEGTKNSIFDDNVDGDVDGTSDQSTTNHSYLSADTSVSSSSIAAIAATVTSSTGIPTIVSDLDVLTLPVDNYTTGTVASKPLSTDKVAMKPYDGRSIRDADYALKLAKKRLRRMAQTQVFHPKCRTCPCCKGQFQGHSRMISHLMGRPKCFTKCDDALQKELLNYVQYMKDNRTTQRENRKLKLLTNYGEKYQQLVQEYQMGDIHQIVRTNTERRPFYQQQQQLARRGDNTESGNNDDMVTDEKEENEDADSDDVLAYDSIHGHGELLNQVDMCSTSDDDDDDDVCDISDDDDDDDDDDDVRDSSDDDDDDDDEDK